MNQSNSNNYVRPDVYINETWYNSRNLNLSTISDLRFYLDQRLGQDKYDLVLGEGLITLCLGNYLPELENELKERIPLGIELNIQISDEFFIEEIFKKYLKNYSFYIIKQHKLCRLTIYQKQNLESLKKEWNEKVKYSLDIRLKERNKMKFIFKNK